MVWLQCSQEQAKDIRIKAGYLKQLEDFFHVFKSVLAEAHYTCLKESIDMLQATKVKPFWVKPV
jgi:hypothetical protein